MRGNWITFAAVSAWPRANTFCAGGGCSGISIAGSAGNSGLSFRAARRLMGILKSCGVVWIDRAGIAEPWGLVIPRDDGGLEAAVQRANQSLSEYQRVHRWIEWRQQDFPRTSTQKPRRNLIQQAAQAQISQPPVQSDSAGRAEISPLAELIAGITGRTGARVSAESNLDSDLGLGSLDSMELLGGLEDRFQVDLSETGFGAAHTVGDLERMLRAQAAERLVHHYPRWALRWPLTWLRFLAHYLLMRPAIVLLGWPRIEWRENLQGSSGPVLVVSNHVAGVDVGFIQ